MDARRFVKKEPLLIISALLAAVTLLFVPLDTVASYDYDRIIRTILTLFFFLLVVEGLKECKALDWLAHETLKNVGSSVTLCVMLVLLPFFSAMLFSNDVSLLTFVPLAMAVLAQAGMKERIPVVIVLQTVAANIGSSLAPFGNPHNLYMFNLMEVYGFTVLEYELALVPLVVVGTAAFLAMSMLVPRKEISVEKEEVRITDTRKLAVIMAMFVLAIATVFGAVPLLVTLAVMVAVFLVIMPRMFLRLDYGILMVFFFLFVFANGMTSIPSLYSSMSDLMDSQPLLTTVLVSQFTTNVSATLLLQPFTSDWAAVLVGADIGGFGTPIASMAAVITLRLYLLREDRDMKRYFKTFFIINAVMLAVLIPVCLLIRL